MIIKSLTLENFRQFTDRQTITFSTDSKKKSTLVIAKNHTGKTTIIKTNEYLNRFSSSKYASCHKTYQAR